MIFKKTYRGKTAGQWLKHAVIAESSAGMKEIFVADGVIARPCQDGMLLEDFNGVLALLFTSIKQSRKFKQLLEKRSPFFENEEVLDKPKKIAYIEARNESIKASAVYPIITRLKKHGYLCNSRLAARLWARFSDDQSATWISISSEDLDRFIAWIDADLDRDEAFS